MNRKILFSLAIVGSMMSVSTTTRAQDASAIADILRAQQQDASKILGAYLSPVVKGAAFGLSQGWYHTGKAHKTLGFDLGVSVHMVTMPTSENFFDPAKLNLQNTTLVTPVGGKAPTLLGPDQATTYASTYDPDGSGPIPIQTFTFNGPEGVDLKGETGVSAVPMAMVQLGIGIWKNTDLKVRYVPTIGSGDAEFSMFGIGVLHDIKQHIPGIKLLPFDLSALVGYNSIKGQADISGALEKPNGYTGAQELQYTFNSWVVQGIISKKFSVLTVYAGAGYAIVKGNVDVVGQYEVPTNVPGVNFTVRNPISISENHNTARLTGGIRLKFGPLYFNGEYTLQKYNTYSAGIGIAVR